MLGGGGQGETAPLTQSLGGKVRGRGGGASLTYLKTKEEWKRSSEPFQLR